MTRSLLTTALLCAGLFVVVGPAIAQPVAPPVPSACLRQRNIYDFKTVPGNNRSLVVIDLTRNRYRLNFMNTCYNLQYHLGLGFKTRSAGTLSCVAKGDSVLQRDVVGPQECIIQSVEYQTPALDKADADAAAAAKAKKQ